MNSNRLRVLLVALVAVLSASLGAALASAAPWNAGGAEPRPTAAADAYRATEDEVLARSADDGVLANDVGAADATLIIGVTHGALTLDGDGSFVYTPEPDFSGRDSFTYRADNEAGEGNLAMVTITVGAVNDQPVAVADAYSVSEDGALEVPAIAGVLANDRDKEADALTVLLLSGVGHGSLTLEADGSFSYAPERDFTGTDEFTYRATDGSDDSQAVTVTITVTAHVDRGPVDDTPRIVGMTGVPDVDAVIEAILGFRGDYAPIRTLLRYAITECTLELGGGGPPKCWQVPGAAQVEGTEVEVFPTSVCSAQYEPRGVNITRMLGELVAAGGVTGSVRGVHAIYQLDGATPSEGSYWPDGDYAVVFLVRRDDQVTGTRVRIADGGIVRIDFGCGPTPPEQLAVSGAANLLARTVEPSGRTTVTNR